MIDREQVQARLDALHVGRDQLLHELQALKDKINAQYGGIQTCEFFLSLLDEGGAQVPPSLS